MFPIQTKQEVGGMMQGILQDVLAGLTVISNRRDSSPNKWHHIAQDLLIAAARNNFSFCVLVPVPQQSLKFIT